MKVDRDGVTLVYDTIGDGPPLLMLHGGLVDSRSWHGQHRLADELQLIMPDTRGFGSSDSGPEGLTMATLADDAAAVLADAGAAGVHVLGFSIGGLIAQALAVRHPELVLGLILVGSVSTGAPIPRPPTGGVVVSHLDRVFSPAFKTAAGKEVLAAYSEMAAENSARGGIGALVQAVPSGPSDEELTRLRCPVLILHGELDGSIPFAQGERLAALIPTARLEPFPGCGHTVHLEAPERFNDAVRRFVLSGGTS